MSDLTNFFARGGVSCAEYHIVGTVTFLWRSYSESVRVEQLTTADGRAVRYRWVHIDRKHPNRIVDRGDLCGDAMAALEQGHNYLREQRRCGK